MREIKAFIHRNRIADVVHALKEAGYKYLTVIDVKGMLKALTTQEQEYSIEIGEKVVTEVKLELVCKASQVKKATEIIRDKGRTGQKDAGWIYISKVEEALPINGEAKS